MSASLFIALFLSPACARREGVRPEAPSVSLTLLTDRPLTVGDPIDVALIVFHDRGARLRYPRDPDEFSPFTLRETSVKTRKLRGGITRTMIVYTLAVYAAGTYQLPPARVDVGDSVLKTDPLPIRILSVLPQETDDPPLKDIVPPYNPRMRPLVAIVIGGALAAAAVSFRYLRRVLNSLRAARREPAVEEPETDPALAAMSALESLKGAGVGIKEAYSRLSSTLRFFIGRTFGIDALRMTTSEIGRKLRREKRALAGGAGIPSDRIMMILRKSDLVKFAKETPSPEAAAEDIEETVRIVEAVRAERPRDGAAAEGGGT